MTLSECAKAVLDYYYDHYLRGTAGYDYNKWYGIIIVFGVVMVMEERDTLFDLGLMGKYDMRYITDAGILLARKMRGEIVEMHVEIE